MHDNDLLRWDLNPGSHHCARCLALNGQVRTAHEWQMTIGPGWHHGCGCMLTHVGSFAEKDLAPPDSVPVGQFGEGPGHGSRGGDSGEGPGHGSEGGQTGEGPGHGSPAAIPPNQDDTRTNHPKDPAPDPVVPAPPPATPPSVNPPRRR